MEVLAEAVTCKATVEEKSPQPRKSAPRLVHQKSEPDLDLTSQSLNTSAARQLVSYPPLIEITRNAWERIDRFVTSHRVIPHARMGLGNPTTERSTIDTFIKECEEMSALYKGLFLNSKDPSPFALQFREFSRALHAQFEECLIITSALNVKKGLSEGELHEAVCAAHGLRTQVGGLIMKMESFCLSAVKESAQSKANRQSAP